jgi:hypothetical protein
MVNGYASKCFRMDLNSGANLQHRCFNIKSPVYSNTWLRLMAYKFILNQADTMEIMFLALRSVRMRYLQGTPYLSPSRPDWSPLAWVQAAVFLLGQWRSLYTITLLHTLNGAAWQTWGEPSRRSARSAYRA